MDALISDVAGSKTPHRLQEQPNKRCRVFSNGDEWKTEVKQQIYSSKLVEALRRVYQRPRRSALPPHAKFVASGRLIRQTADRVLAVTARGRTRWSRAILSNRLRLKLAHRKRTKERAGRKLPTTKKGKGNLAAGKFLGRLVPGCGKLPLPNLLEEATDYISALEMQVRVMTALAELLAGEESNKQLDLLGNPNNSSNSEIS